ncbi:hypothetical protein EVU96_24885 [Bacillus infantis]|uniref:phage protein n=1 Tax=Bacillus infantis TaxID=324767 RepID=UPI00101CD119|nr:hypothetical protein [Bacillus infantis]RYI25204.1 hypothetical protein EVU96_24885 [Bacillus infantis]
MNLYRRKKQLVVGGKLIEDPLTIYFDIPFDDSEKVNDVTIKVYNLSDSTINGFKNGQKVILTAGYEGDTGTIFEGILKKPETNWEGVDKITSLICIDEKGNFLEKDIKKTYAENTNALTILKDLVAQSGLSLGELQLPKNFVYKSGKTIKSKLGKAIIEVARDCLAKVHINRNKIFIRDKNRGDDTGLDIKKETGLIEQPSMVEAETEDVQKKSKVKRTGYSLKILLNHRITTDSILKVSSQKVSGVYRVEKGKHTADGNGFYTEVEVYPL